MEHRVPLLRELRGALTAFALMLCGLLVLVSYDFGIPGQALLQSLRFHLGAALVALVVVLLVTAAWWRAVLFLAVAAVSIGQGGLLIYRQQEARAVVVAQPGKPLLRMLSFNLLQSNMGSGRKIAGFIEQSGADLVLLMEAGPVQPFAAQLAATYPYRTQCPARGSCDMFLLSKTPLTEARVTSMSRIWDNRLITATTVIAGETVQIVGAHMTKPYFDDVSEGEAYIMGGAIRRTEGPLVLAGDFNSAGWSRNIDRLARANKLIPGPAYPATWPVRLGPLGVPIDNMWTRGPLYITSIQALDDAMGSNHRGLLAELSLAGPTP
jgi:endonuclease/exonuclease/phosphatase (EEP) superfamily protein YafD